MAVTQDQYDRLLNRVTALENLCNDLLVAIGRFITLEQVNQLNVLYQQGMADISSQVEALEERVTAIEEEPLT